MDTVSDQVNLLLKYYKAGIAINTIGDVGRIEQQGNVKRIYINDMLIVKSTYLPPDKNIDSTNYVMFIIKVWFVMYHMDIRG